MQARTNPMVHAARWPEVFITERKINDPQFFDTRSALLEYELLDQEKEEIDMAFVNFESSIPSWEIHVIRRFFKATDPLPFSIQRKSARAILDDRDYETGQTRTYARWLDAKGLQGALSAERFNSKNHPRMNADRRLVYIHGLSPDYIISLVKSASSLQISALRDTICKHVAIETSIRIHIPVEAFQTFQLEFHIPFPTLRCAHCASSDTSPISETSWFDVGFLGLKCDAEHEDSTWMLYEANISVVLSGWDHHQWVGWAFSNTLSDLTSEDGDEVEGKEDYFATDGNGPDDGRIVMADSPIWDPREYWLHIVNFRMVIIHKEWSWLTMNVARGIDLWTREQDLKLARKAESPEVQQQVSGWLSRTKRLLRRLDEKFSTTMQIWSNFSASGGHIEYLSEIPGSKITLLVNTLKETFERLKYLHIKLKSVETKLEGMEASFATYVENENSRLIAESHYYNRKTYEIFHEMVKANHDVRYFVREAVRVSHDMAVISQEVRNSGRETSQMCHEIVKNGQHALQLNQKSIQATVDADRTNRANLQLFVVTTPFVLALQYFGADKDIFSFERNAKTFGIAICVMFSVLSVLTYFLNLVNHGWNELCRKLRPEKEEIAI